MTDKKNMYCNTTQKKLLREFYLGKRTARHFKAFRFVQRLKLAGLIEDDGLDYPPGAGPRHVRTQKVPTWVKIQAARVALFVILIPEAERLLNLEPTTPEPLSRYRLFEILGLPRSSGLYKQIAPKLDENMASHLLECLDNGSMDSRGLHPWHSLKCDTQQLARPYPYPPPELDEFLPDEWYDRFGEDYEEVDGSLEPIPWNRRWSSQLRVVHRKNPLPPDRKAIREPTQSDKKPQPDHKEIKKEILDIF